MKESVIWGAIVGIALGVMVTFALARGLFALPWQVQLPAEAPAAPSMQPWQDVDSRTRTSVLPQQRADAEPRRPARPGTDLASATAQS